MCVPECARAAWRSQYLRRLARKIPSPACGGRCPEGGRGDENLVFTLLEANPVTTRRLARKIPSPACGGRCPEGGRGDENPAFTSLEAKPVTRRRLARPVFTPLEANPVTTLLGEASIYVAWHERFLSPLAGEGARRAEGGMKIQHLRRLARFCPVIARAAG